MSFQALRLSINKHFDLREIRTICFDLGINSESFPNSTRDEMVRGLIDYCKRRNKLGDLLDWLKHERPDVDWPDLESLQAEEIPLGWDTRSNNHSPKSTNTTTIIIVSLMATIVIVTIFILMRMEISDFIDNFRPELVQNSETSTPNVLNTQTPTSTPLNPVPTETSTTVAPMTPELEDTIVESIDPTVTPTILNLNLCSFEDPIGHIWEEIPSGQFLMGSPEKDVDAFPFDRPLHRLDIPYTYCISKYEITNAQYKMFIDAGNIENLPEINESCPVWREDGSYDESFANYPVVCVSWYDAVAYTEWLGEEYSLLARLPTEAEWEKAARGDQDDRIYTWGNNWEDGIRLNCANEECANIVDRLEPIGSYPSGASPYAVEDMLGNVAEWTSSLYGNDRNVADFIYPYDPNDGREDLLALDTVARVIRGGSFVNGRAFTRVSARNSAFPHQFDRTLGFRIVIEEPPASIEDITIIEVFPTPQPLPSSTPQPPPPTTSLLPLFVDLFEEINPDWSTEENTFVENSSLIVDRMFLGSNNRASRRTIDVSASCFIFSTSSTVQLVEGESTEDLGIAIEFWLPTNAAPNDPNEDDVNYFIFQMTGGAHIRLQPNNFFDPDKDSVAFYPDEFPGIELDTPVEIQINYNNENIEVFINGFQLLFDPDWRDIYSTETSTMENIRRIGLGSANLIDTEDERMVVGFDYVRIDSCE